jgi:hypothetical protein
MGQRFGRDPVRQVGKIDCSVNLQRDATVERARCGQQTHHRVAAQAILGT